jgi:ribosomal protein S25
MDIDPKRRAVFEFIFGEEEGHFCVATRNARTGHFSEKFFRYPQELDEALNHCNRLRVTCDVWFCPQLFSHPKRKKEFAQSVTVAWGDLDDCHYDKMLIEPTVVLETSRDRYQGLWRFEEAIHPTDAEDISRRIAYFHEAEGMDKSGWDLTQLLRVPLTLNHKYANTAGLRDVEVVIARPERKYTEKDFNVYPEVKEFQKQEIPFPEAGTLPKKNARELLDANRMSINPRVWTLFEDAPHTDWSKNLWELHMLLFEQGFSKEEVYTITSEAACNKYARDNRSNGFLWKDVVRAYSAFEDNGTETPTTEEEEEPEIVVPEVSLLTEDERKMVESERSFVEEYIDWAKGLGDAAWQYHQAGAFVVLSALLSSNITLPTSYGNVAPNLWFMILGDTTLTRKTTAMDLSIDFLSEIDPEAILATDGSIEGLLTSMSMRPRRASIFLRDEFSGLLEMMTKRDYYAGMLETLTKLYDGRSQKRVLRKETIDVRDPILILFAGGIRDRILGLLTYDHVGSGFLPRMIFIAANTDVTKLRPLGPPTTETLDKREELVDYMRDIYEHYNIKKDVQTIGNQISLPKPSEASLTDDAWVRYNKFEAALLKIGIDSNQTDITTPTFDRMAKSGLKAAVLLAASRRKASQVIVEEKDIVRAFYYIEQWRPYTMEVLQNIGKTAYERTLDKVLKAVERSPGVRRSTIMQRYRLTSRDAEVVFGTLEQRGQLRRIRAGRGERLYLIEKG